MSDAVKVADGFRDRLANLAAEYGKFKLAADLPAPSRESYSKFTDPVDELFDRLGRMEPAIKILEGLIIPKTMKGAREAWVFVVPLMLCVGFAVVMELPATGIAGLALTGLAVGGLLRTWLVQLSRTQLQRTLQPAHAIAGRRRRTGRLLPCTGRIPLCRGTQAGGHPARRRYEARKENHVRAIEIGETKRDERIRQINEIYAQRMVDIQTTQAQRDERGRRVAPATDGRDPDTIRAQAS